MLPNVQIIQLLTYSQSTGVQWSLKICSNPHHGWKVSNFNVSFRTQKYIKIFHETEWKAIYILNWT